MSQAIQNLSPVVVLSQTPKIKINISILDFSYYKKEVVVDCWYGIASYIVRIKFNQLNQILI